MANDGRIRLAILDWAGTTVDYGCYAPTVVFMEVFRRQGVEISVAQARAPMGRAKREHIKAISEQPEVATKWRNATGQGCTDADVDEMFEKHFRPLQIECIARYAGLIPGTLDAVSALRERGILIGTTTGYFTEAAEINRQEAERQGYVPDSTVCASDVPAGRPEPWMVFRNMELTGVYPPAVVLKVGDTLPDIGEGRNASTWTVGLSRTGNEVGLTESELQALPKCEANALIDSAGKALEGAGAHVVLPSIAELPDAVDEIERRISAGERP